MTTLHTRIAVLIIISAIGLFAAVGRLPFSEDASSPPDPGEICLEIDHSGMAGMVCASQTDHLMPAAVRTLRIPRGCQEIKLPRGVPPCSRVVLAGDSSCEVIRVEPMPAARRLVCGGGIDPNNDSMEDLALLPGVGETRARAIIRHREESGPFRQVEDLQKIHGIGPKTVVRMAPWIRMANGQ